VTSYLSFTSVCLHTSMTRGCNEKIAKKMHKNLLTVMGDRKVKKVEEIQQATAEIQSTGMTRRDMREELYCQFVKQLTKNPSADSVSKGWELMHLCLDSFPPGEALENYLECWLRSNAPDSKLTIGKLYKAVTEGNDPILQGVVRVRGESKVNELDIISGSPDKILAAENSRKSPKSPSSRSSGDASLSSLDEDDEEIEPIPQPQAQDDLGTIAE
jgi:hypothetical protein